jgi:branched-chain amino acid transport system permease protein
MLAALAGGIIGPIWSASPSMGQDILLKGFAVVVVGGMGNARGCVITGLLLGVSEALFGQYISMFYRDVYAFAILIVVCLVRPQGLFANA